MKIGALSDGISFTEMKTKTKTTSLDNFCGRKIRTVITNPRMFRNRRFENLVFNILLMLFHTEFNSMIGLTCIRKTTLTRNFINTSVVSHIAGIF